MTEKEDSLGIGEEDDDFLLLEDEILSAENQHSTFRRHTPKAQSNGLTIRIVILVLFLLALGGLGFYYFNWVTTPPVPTNELEARPELPPAGQVAPANDADYGQPTAPALPPPASTQLPPEQPLPGTNTPDTKTGVTPISSQPASTRRAASAPAEVQGQIDKAKPAVSAPGTQYTLQAGVFLLKTSMAKAEKIIRELGYTPKVTTFTEETEMTRVLVGTFPEQQAQAFLAELKPKVPEAFPLREGAQVSVYAGSFSVPGEAAKMLKQLAAQGIDAKEVVVKLPMPMYRVTFGTFPDRDGARRVAEKAAGAGLEMPLIKKL